TVLQFLPAEGESLATSGTRLTDVQLKRRVLWLLRFSRYRTLNRPPMDRLFKQALAIAADDDDQAFFKALGERLKDKPIPFKSPSKPTPLTKLLLEHWIVKSGICFCWFSDNALTQFLKQTHESYTPDAIRKARERLRLYKLRHPIVRSVEKVDNR